MFLKRLAT